MPTISISCEHSIEEMKSLLRAKRIKLGIARSRGQGEKAAEIAMEVFSLELAISSGKPAAHLRATFD